MCTACFVGCDPTHNVTIRAEMFNQILNSYVLLTKIPKRLAQTMCSCPDQEELLQSSPPGNV